MSPSVQLLGTIFHNNHRRIVLTYALVFLEETLELLYPFVIGFAINELVSGSLYGLWIFVLQYFTHILVGSIRRFHDTRTYTGIYARLATGVVLEQHRQRRGLSQIVARSGMLSEFVDFFESDIPYIVQSLFAVIGAIIMLAFYDPTLAVVAIGVFIPVCLINRAYFRLSNRLNKGLNNHFEREVRCIETRKPQRIKKYYNLLAFWYVRLSDAEALNYGVVHVFMMTLMAVAIYRSVTAVSLEIGDIFAVISYTWGFIIGLDSVPELIQKVSRLRDIGKRVQEDV